MTDATPRGYPDFAAPGLGVVPYFPELVTPAALSIRMLDNYKTVAPPQGYPGNFRTFYSPVDRVKEALACMLSSARQSLIVCMYGFDDDDFAEIIHRKLIDEKVFVQLTLDKTQAGGAHEKLLLDKMKYPASSIAIGSSEHGRIIHTKLVVIDGLFVVGGSTNWSAAGEELQDNELTVIQDPYVAAEATTRISRIHAHVLQEAK